MNSPSRPVPGRPATPRPSTGPVSESYLPGSHTAPREARAAVRNALASWGLSELSPAAELLVSELVANASEHAASSPIQLLVWPQVEPDGRLGIICEVSDESPELPQPSPLRPDSARGRGLGIVASMANSSGVTPNRNGKTAWFTLTTAWPDRTPPSRYAEPEAEPGA
jgi:hypothetical protein